MAAMICPMQNLESNVICTIIGISMLQAAAANSDHPKTLFVPKYCDS